MAEIRMRDEHAEGSVWIACSNEDIRAVIRNLATQVKMTEQCLRRSGISRGLPNMDGPITDADTS